MNGAQAPGASVIGPSTRRLLGWPLNTSWLLNTKMFVKVMLPELQTDPKNATRLSAVTGPGGQLSVMVMAGVVATGQLVVLVIQVPLQVSWPVTVMVTAQVLEGTVRLPLYCSD